MGVFGGRYGERSHERIARLEADLAAARQRIEELGVIVDGLRGDNEFPAIANHKACDDVAVLRQRIAELEAEQESICSALYAAGIPSASEDGYGENAMRMRALLDRIKRDRQRIAELEADAALGALVRRMPSHWALGHIINESEDPHYHWAVGSIIRDDERQLATGNTPEAALREALEEQDG